MIMINDSVKPVFRLAIQKKSAFSKKIFVNYFKNLLKNLYFSLLHITSIIKTT